MAEPTLKIERDDDRTTVHVAGEIDLASAPALERRVLEAIAGGARAVTLDMSEVSFMDSTGLRSVLTIREAALAAGGSLVLSRPSEPVRRLLDVSGLADRIQTQA